MTDPLEETVARMKQRNRQDLIIYVIEPALLLGFVIFLSFVVEAFWWK